MGFFCGFVDSTGVRKTLPTRQGSGEEAHVHTNEPTVIPSQDSLIGDLLSMDIGGTIPAAAPVTQPASNVDLLDVLVSCIDPIECEEC